MNSKPHEYGGENKRLVFLIIEAEWRIYASVMI